MQSVIAVLQYDEHKSYIDGLKCKQDVTLMR